MLAAVVERIRLSVELRWRAEILSFHPGAERLAHFLHVELFDLRDALGHVLTVLRQFAHIQGVNLSFLLDLVFEARLLKVLRKSLGQAALVLRDDAVSQEESLLDRQEAFLAGQYLDAFVFDLASDLD